MPRRGDTDAGVSSVPRRDPAGARGVAGVSSRAQATRQGGDALRLETSEVCIVSQTSLPWGKRLWTQGPERAGRGAAFWASLGGSHRHSPVSAEGTPAHPLLGGILERRCRPNRITRRCPEITETASPGSTFNVARYLFHSINFTSYRGT